MIYLYPSYKDFFDMQSITRKLSLGTPLLSDCQLQAFNVDVNGSVGQASFVSLDCDLGTL